MLRGKGVVCAPFTAAPHRKGVAFVRVVPCSRCGLRPARQSRLQCHALDNRGQQPYVANPGSGVSMHFEISAEESAPHPVREATASPVADPAKPASASWETWLKVFEQMDRAYEQQEELKQQLQEAVRREQYSQAAAFKQQLSQVQGMDAVAQVQASLSQALQEERYEDAATLRDQGMAWLQGWWRGMSANDPVGHLMHVTPEFGRYTGRVYTARDLADLAGLRESSMMGGGLPQLRAAMQADSSSLRTSSSVGSPAMEVFVASEGADLSHQVVSLMGAAQQQGKQEGSARAERPPSPLGSDNTVGSLAAMLGLGLLMRLSVTVEADGSAVLRAAPVEGSDGGGKEASDTEGAEAGSSGKTKSKLVGWEAVAAEDPEEDGAAAAAAAAEQLSDSEQALVAAALDSLRAGREEQLASGSGSSTPAAAEDTADQMVVDVHAARAVEIDATRSGDHSEGDDESPSSSSSGSSSSGFTELHRSPAELERLSVDQFVLRVPQGATTTAGSSTSSSTSASTPQHMVRFDILVPAGKLMLTGSNGSQRAQATVTAVAERVVRAQAKRGGRAVDPEALRAGLQTLLKGLEAGKPVEVVIPAVNSDDESDAATTASSSAAASAVTAVRYTRVPMETRPKSDPLSGLYVGSFGPHGPELLQLRRVMVEGEEMVEALKVTGDSNVPAGNVSFRAKVGRKHKQSASGVYPDELGVTARYKGQGHVAGKNYSRPKWVEGELLVFSSNSPLTNGAQLGFVWHVPGERKFLILLNKVDLGSCAERSASLVSLL